MLKRLTAILGRPARQHRPFNEGELKLLKPMCGVPMTHALNPGIRIEPEWINAQEAAMVVPCLRGLLKVYGSSNYNGDTEIRVLEGSDKDRVIRTEKNKVNSMRMTGRPEGTNVPCPWGYGDDFDMSKVPQPLKMIQERIMESRKFNVGPPRDITINYRQHSQFKLDPHFDPRTDGGNIFIINFLSYVVLTLTPEHPVNTERRQEPVSIALQSYTDQDIDVLFKPQSMVHLSEDAVYKWHHAIRIGLQTDDGSIVDWFGSKETLLKRNRERFSVVMAFGNLD
eukprot:CFRG8360T1